METRQREVVRHGLSSVLARHDVIELEWRPVQSLWHPAVFATPGGTLPDLVRQSLVHGSDGDPHARASYAPWLEKGQEMAQAAVFSTSAASSWLSLPS